MLDCKDIAHNAAPTQPNVDGAVGVAAAKWFIAIVNNRSEKTVAEKLARMGIDQYVPVQTELRVWASGKKVMVDKVMIPSKVFVHCTEHERRDIVNLPFIFRFMTDRARSSTHSMSKPLAVVPDHEMEQLKFMLGVPDAKVAFTDTFAKGDKVKVRRGPFKGLTGIVLQDAGNRTSHLYINIDFLGSAYVEIDPKDVAPCQD